MSEPLTNSYRSPANWAWTELENIVPNPKNDIVDGPFGSNLKASEYIGEGIPIIRLQNIDRNNFIDKNIKFISPEKANQLNRHSFSGSDIVLTKLGDPLGKACIVPEGFGPGIIVADVVRIKLDEEYISKKYLVYAINSDAVIKQLSIKTKGTTRPRVNLAHIRKLKIPISPLPEQHRIVARIEELFSRLDAGVQALQKARAQLQRYRQSVLRAAVTGRLTAEWRAAHPEVEPAEELLKRILTDRRSKWEEKELVKMRSRQKTPKNGRWKEKYKNPRSISVQADLPEIPANWAYTFIDPILSIERTGMKTGPFGSLLKKEEHKAEGIPVLGIENIEYLKFIRGSKIHISEKKADQLWDYDARPGDIIISRSGTVGEVCVIPEDIERAIISTNLMRVTLNSSAMLPRFFCLLLKGSPFVMSQISELCKGSTRSFLNQEILSSIVFPIAPICEQCIIVDEVERYHSYVEQFQDELRRDFVCISHLRRSILQRAFQGQLVPQDPSDEPASLLLERIRAERIKEPPRRGRKSNNHQARPAQ